uniref:Uncharacterized protein n=1 Tax=Aplanochytrium stocchinoi TaxID=215587 RepID=A0A7S3PHV1_9STRA|mmetsp:Transcript_7298/g.9246  ORF Transcript_7298/g.9246 Transcript_7298/m.9246 type:complete len:186 (-) Transcript_7298:30-587(-)
MAVSDDIAQHYAMIEKLQWSLIFGSAFAVFGISLITNAMWPRHKRRAKPLPEDKEFQQLIKKHKLKQPGMYYFPVDETIATPSGFIRVHGVGYTSRMGLVQAFLGFLVNLFVSFMVVFFLVWAEVELASMAASLMAGLLTTGFYNGGILWLPIWRPYSIFDFSLDLLDGILYGVVTAAMFTLLLE